MSERGWKVTGILLTAGILAGCGRHGEEAPGSAELPAVEVSVVEVAKRDHLRKQALPGTVQPADQAVIAAKIMATVESVAVDIGQRVDEGEVLVTLRADEIVAQVEQAEAVLAQLERNLEREEVLLEQSATTAESVRTLQDEIRVALARLEEARTMERYLRIRAPYAGIITTREVMRGDLATPGTPLMTLESLGNLEVHVQVPDSLIALGYGDPVEISDSSGSYTATVSEWSPAADPSSRTRLAKLGLPDGTGLRSGQYVRVNWPAEQSTSLWMPVEALSTMGQLERAFLFREGRVEMQLIKTGMEESGFYQILSGLKEDDQVVLNPTPTLRDGQPATIQP